MELIKFLKDNRDYFNLKNIDNGAGLPSRTLNNVINGNRNLSEKSAEKLLKFFDALFVDLEYEFVDRRYTREPENKKHMQPTQKLPNLKRDGSFDMNHWEIIAVKMCHKTEPHMVKYEIIDKKYYPRG